MKFSAQEEYGLRCLLAIAHEGTLTIPEVGQLEGLSQPHVAKLLSILRKSGLISSTRGQSGGYSLAIPPEKVLVGEVLAVLGGRLYESGFCERHSGIQTECAHNDRCSLRGLWARVQSAVDQVVYQLTLKDLMEEQTRQGNWVVLQKVPRRSDRLVVPGAS